MEGLLPMVYRAIKKNRIRSKYECLSSGAAMSYNISRAEMIYPQTQDHGYQNASTQNVGDDNHAEKIGHRRYKSVGDFSVGFSSSPQQRTRPAACPAPKQLVRFRSHRMFSCITGV